MFPSTMAPKRPILVSQCEIDHQKSSILLIFSTLSLGGCGGHPMRPELNLKDKSQMSTPNEYTDNFKPNLICIFPSVRAKLKKPLCPRTQCSQLFYFNIKPVLRLSGMQNVNDKFGGKCFVICCDNYDFELIQGLLSIMKVQIIGWLQSSKYLLFLKVKLGSIYI